ncbi:hypothetical protein [Mediterraneibacter sp. ICN-202921]|uniref:hypothetical protein n=1 Tax=Mediterraneibacter sp. ICN-202921 TaxID=3134657 RepID=UPI0030BF309B
MRNKKVQRICIYVIHVICAAVAVWLCMGLSPVKEETHGKEKEEMEDTEENCEKPQILCSSPDGANGWYRSAPKVQIIHTDENTVTRYEIKSESGKQIDGELKWGEVIEYTVPEDFWEEGEHTIRVWMTDAEEEIYKEERSVRVDRIAPVVPEISYPTVSEYMFCTNTELEIAASSADQVSGIEKIVFMQEETEFGCIEEKKGSIVVSPPFYGKLHVYAVDKAGNKSIDCSTEEILCEAEEPEISISMPETESGWYTDGVDIIVDIWEMVSEMEKCAGLKEVCCFVNGNGVWEKSYNREDNIKQEHILLRAEERSFSKEPVQIVIEAADHAGNTAVQSREIYIDGQTPLIRAEGLYEDMITAQAQTVRIYIEDENIVEDFHIEISRTSPEGEVYTEAGGTPVVYKETEQAREIGYTLTEEGEYRCVVTAEDQAGHMHTEEYHFILDKTSPVIRYVSQLNGIYIPYFEWNYGKEELIQDFTDYTYHIYMDGMPYLAGERITEEGVKILQVTAEDKAGNVSNAYAVFIIDHTAPDIRWKGVENGKIYKEKAVLSVWVDKEGEWLRKIEINDEQQKIGPGSQIIQYEFSAAGQYQITAEAEDLAGNRSKSEMTFTVQQQMTAAERMAEPVRNLFREEKDSGRRKEKDVNDSLHVLWGLGILLLGSVLIIVGRIHRGWHRKDPKE